MVLLGMRAAFGNSIFPDKPCLEICKQQYQSYKNNYCPIFCFKIFVHFFWKYPSLSIQGVLHGGLGLGKRKDFEALLQASCLSDDLPEFFSQTLLPLLYSSEKSNSIFCVKLKRRDTSQ